MKQQLINNITQGMLRFLNNSQLAQLREVLEREIARVEVFREEKNCEEAEQDNAKLIEAFLAAKRVEGCSEKSLKYYRKTIETSLGAIQKRVQEVSTDDLRTYLTNYQQEKNASRVTVDNIRRILSSYFTWLEEEDYIASTGMRVGNWYC